LNSVIFERNIFQLKCVYVGPDENLQSLLICILHLIAQRLQWSILFFCLFSVAGQIKRTAQRSASSGNVLDAAPGLSQRLSQIADPSLVRVPSESAVQQEAMSMLPTPAPPAPPLPATNTGGLAQALQSAQLRRTPKVCIVSNLHLSSC